MWLRASRKDMWITKQKDVDKNFYCHEKGMYIGKYYCGCCLR